MSDYGSRINNSTCAGDSQSQINASNENLDDSTSEPGNNNSIIGKVKSRVSSILPTSLSKWFSAPNKNDDALNGSISCNNNPRRRRRIEIESDDEIEFEINGEEDVVTRHRVYNENVSSTQRNENYNDESNHSDEDSFTFANSNSRRRHINSPPAVRQPPSKRSKQTLNLSNTEDPTFISCQRLVSSTPAIGENVRSETTQPTHSKLLDNQNVHNNPYDAKNKYQDQDLYLSPSTSRQHRYQSNSIAYDYDAPLQNSASNANTYDMKSRRSLNISSQNIPDRVAGLSNFKRQSLSNYKSELPCTSSAIVSDSNQNAYPRRTSTTIIDSAPEPDVEEDEAEEDICENETLHDIINHNNNVSLTNNKRQNLTNGEAGFYEPSTSAARRCSRSESSEVDGRGNIRDQSDGTTRQHKSGLYNLSACNSRSGSRTSSFGNGLNFYSHLDGRKSLFSGAHGNPGSSINNSTLSLNSLSRRQFNASIYGSTSALSDSRLLNTFSPFYKGRTTYGGASAYNKHKLGVGTGAGASSVRMTPTLIRPTSSLSTLSSSSNSLANPAENSTISSTAKRILDLIEEFSTPISEVNKMGHNLRANQHHLLATKTNRLNDADINASRALRLSKVQSPYMRPKVILQPNPSVTGLPPVRELQVPCMSQLLQMQKMQNSVERSRQIANQSAAQFPSQSQQHASATTTTAAYTLPTETVDSAEQRQPMRSNKMKNKTNFARITASKDVYDEAPPPPLNLENIAFPLMQSVPKIDIQLPTSKPSLPQISQTKAVIESVKKNPIPVENIRSIIKEKGNVEQVVATKTSLSSQVTPTIKNINSSTSMEFEFSEPLSLIPGSTSTQNITVIDGNFKFSPPALVQLQEKMAITPLPRPIVENQNVPQLKTGSVLDALKKDPFKVPKSTTNDAAKYDLNFNTKFAKTSNEWDCTTCLVRNKMENSKCVACNASYKPTPPKIATENELLEASTSFGNRFTKSSDEWECDTCMVRNKQGVKKCIACETTRKDAAPIISSVTSLTSTSHQFGDAFKPASNSWECGTCLIINKKESSECIACQTKKPGSKNAVSQPVTSAFKFGFSNNTSLSKESSKTAADSKLSIAPDAGFKLIVEKQKAAKWECDACMTQNDTSRTKCICCEQVKPGSEPQIENVPKFSFGVSSNVSKFNFGFGAAANVSTEDNLRQSEGKESKASTVSTAIASPSTAQKTDAEPKGFTLGNANTSTNNSFSFGIKPVTTEMNKDKTDSKEEAHVNKTSGEGFKFGASAANSSSGFTFGTFSAQSKSAESATNVATNSTIANVPRTTNTENVSSTSNKIVTSLPSFTLPSVTSTSTNKSNEGFSFGTTNAARESNENKTSLSGADTSIKSFIPSSTNNIKFGVTPITTSNNVNSTDIVVPVPAKPLINFSVPNSMDKVNTSTDAAKSSNAGGFAFGSPLTAPATSNLTIDSFKSNSAAGFAFGAKSDLPPTTKLTFGADTKSTVGTTSVNATKTFGNVFGSPSSTATPPKSLFGDVKATTSSVISSTTTTPSTLSNTKVFGSFGSSSDANKSTSLQFGSDAKSTPETKSFVFGSSTPELTANSAASSAVTSTHSAWPKNTFAFGLTDTASANKKPEQSANVSSQQPQGFGGFGMAQTETSNKNNSIFGNVNATSTANQGAVAIALGSSTATTKNIFGTNPSSASSSPSTNLFSSNIKPNENATVPAFGTALFGSVATPQKSAFGSAITTQNAFGSGATNQSAFGGPTSTSTQSTFGSFGNIPTNVNPTDGASAAKKSEPAFTFGTSTATATQSASGGFNFGANATAVKPAFNFNASSQPTFNFTGAADAVPNAPFQFGAGAGAGAAATSSNNIFAPTPTPGAPLNSQVRRKIRTPVRRVTPR